MGRLAMVSEVLLFASFVVLAKIPEISTATSKYANHEFLAGENTPVWFAEVNQKEVVYTKMATSFPIVQSSIYHWKGFKQNRRVVRSADDSKHFTRPEKLSAPSDARDDSFYSSKSSEKRSTAENEVIYPSILVVMDYNTFLQPATRTAWMIEELVLYALAFWGSVDASLRNITNPRISLRIAGIIITTSRDSSPYLSTNGGGQSFVTDLTPMVGYWRWRWLMKQDPDLPIGSYDIVAHMTDLYPSSVNGSSDPMPKNESILAAGLQGPPCILPDRIAGLIVYDDFVFGGLHRTIGQMTKVLGGNELSPKDYGWPSGSWSGETLNLLSNARKTASCMSAPKEYHPPGAPVQPILAGEVVPSGKQCEVYGNWPDGWSCWETPLNGYSCYFLRCSKQHSSSDACPQGPFTLHGHLCNAENTKICLDGKCVDKKGIFGIPENNDEEPLINVTSTMSTSTTTTMPTTTSPRPLYEKDGFLMGEETPVWIVTYKPKPRERFRSYDFKRVKPNESPSIVKRALNYWDSLKKGGGFPFRKKRSIDDRGNLTYTEQFHDALKNTGINGFDSPSLVEKRSADSNEVVYPTVLVVMDYATRRTVEEHVLYALAFWSTVDSTMRNIQNPRVSLRIAGIVITASRDATPYLRGYKGPTFDWALGPMIEYWRSMSEKRTIDLPYGSYDIVVHMTDIFPFADSSVWRRMFRDRKKYKPSKDFFGGTASKITPCRFTNQVSAVIVRDYFDFDGIQRAITHMSTALGGRDTPRPYHLNFLTRWTTNMLASLSNSLKHASCMSAPKEHHPPGAPVAPILAGELVPNEKQCEHAGYNPDAWTCWDTSYNARRSTCRDLQCSNMRVWGLSCNKVGRPLEGSFCNTDKTMICLDEQCVDKK